MTSDVMYQTLTRMAQVVCDNCFAVTDLDKASGWIINGALNDNLKKVQFIVPNLSLDFTYSNFCADCAALPLTELMVP